MNFERIGVAAWLVVVAASAVAKGDEPGGVGFDPEGHTGSVYAVAYSPDGKTLASAGDRGEVRLWDVAADRAGARPVGHEGRVAALAFSPDGKTLATGGEDHGVRLWDVATGAPSATLQGHTGEVEAVAFSPDGKTLASAGGDLVIRLWDVAGRRQIRALEGHIAAVHALAFRPDGKTLASAGGDLVIRLWDMSKEGEPTLLRGHSASVRALAFDAEGKTLASTGRDKTVRLWDRDATASRSIINLAGEGMALAFSPQSKSLAVATSATTGPNPAPGLIRQFDPATGRTRPRMFRGHPSIVWALAFSPDGKSLATAGDDRSVRTWDTLTARAQSVHQGGYPPGTTPDRFLMAHLDPVEAVAIAPGGKAVAVASSTSVTLWDCPTGAVRRLLTAARSHWAPVAGTVLALAYSPDGSILAAGGKDRAVTLWNVEGGRVPATLEGDDFGVITSLAFSPDGKTLAFGSQDASVTLWDVASKARRATLARHTSAVTAIAFSPDGETLASCGQDWSVKTWDVGKGSLLKSFEGHSDWVFAVAFSPDGKTLGSASRDGSARLWDVANGSLVRSFRVNARPVHALAFLADGSFLTGDDDSSIRRWTPSDGRLIALVAGAHDGPVTSLAVSSDGKTVATGGADRKLKLWDVDRQLSPRKSPDVGPKPPADDAGKSARAVLKGSGKPLRSLIFSEDGPLLATPEDSGAVKLWDVATGRLLATFRGHDGPIAWVGFSPDGLILATAGRDGGARTWDAPSNPGPGARP